MALRVQVPNDHILAQNLHQNHYYPKPKYLMIGYMDPQAQRALPSCWAHLSLMFG